MIIIRLTFWPRLVMWWRRVVLREQPRTYRASFRRIQKTGDDMTTTTIPVPSKSILQVQLKEAIAGRQQLDRQRKGLQYLQQSITLEAYEAMAPEVRLAASEILYNQRHYNGVVYEW